MDRTPIADEVERRMKAAGQTPKGLSKKAGLNDTYVRDLLDGSSKNPKAEQLAKLAAALGCTVDDLRPDRVKLRVLEAPPAREDVDQTAISEINTFVGMGGGGLEEMDREGAPWTVPTLWLRNEVRGSLDNLRILTLEGDSMAGTLEPGDKVLVDLNRITPSPPGVFVVYDGVALVAKRLEYIQGSDPPSIRITSDNIRYAAYERTLEEVHVIGRIMGRWQRLS